MLNTVREYMKKHKMIEPSCHILVGVSGGADSVCLLDILDQLRSEYQLTLTVVHIEHGVRGESSLKDMEFVQALCKERKIQCICEQHKMKEMAEEQGLSEEEAGRIIRYEAFERIAREVGADRIAVAHHGNDLAETMLFFLSRGTSLSGLAPIRPVRGNIIRPLLCVQRSEIEEYLRKHQLNYCIDETNSEIKYTRNRIRHQIIPELNEVNSQAVAHLCGVQESYLLAEEVLGDAVALGWKQCVEEMQGGILLKKELFEEFRAYVVYEVVKKAITQLSGKWKDVERVHLELICGLNGLQVGRRIDLPYGLMARRDYSGIILSKKDTFQNETNKQNTKEHKPCIPVTVPCRIELWDGKVLETRWIEADNEIEIFPAKTYTKWFDYDIIKDNLCVRYAEPEDYMVIDRNGGRKKMKKLFVDAKIPSQRRNNVVVLASGSQVFWAVDVRMDETAKISQFTKRIIEVKIHGGKKYE